MRYISSVDKVDIFLLPYMIYLCYQNLCVMYLVQRAGGAQIRQFAISALSDALFQGNNFFLKDCLKCSSDIVQSIFLDTFSMSFRYWQKSCG